MTSGEKFPMKSMLRAAVIGLAILTAACNQDAATNNADAMNGASAAQAGKDWTNTVVATPGGGFLMGNPAAPVKLLEFGSFTCPHCRAFHDEAEATLKQKYIASGKVSYEFRSFILNGIDVPVSLLAYCMPPSAFFPTQDGLYGAQESWVGKLSKAGDELEKLQSAPPEQQFASILRITGLDQFFKLRGLPEAKQTQCLNDQAMLKKLADIRSDAVKSYNLTGTPTFVINGTTQENVYDWKSLQPKLDEALK